MYWGGVRTPRFWRNCVGPDDPKFPFVSGGADCKDSMDGAAAGIAGVGVAGSPGADVASGAVAVGVGAGAAGVDVAGAGVVDPCCWR